MISNETNQSSGLPPPVTKLTVEQDLKMRLLHDALTSPEAKKEDIITIFMALQHQCFVLSNSLTNLVTQWHKHTQTEEDPDTIKEAEAMFGTLFGSKDSTTTSDAQ